MLFMSCNIKSYENMLNELERCVCKNAGLLITCDCLANKHLPSELHKLKPRSTLTIPYKRLILHVNVAVI